MKAVGIWLCAVPALAVTACGQARKPAAHVPAKVETVAPAPEFGAAGQQPMAAATAAAGQQPPAQAAAAAGRRPDASARADAEAARSNAASGRAAGRASAAGLAEARLTRPGSRREPSSQGGDDAEILAADLSWGPSDAREHGYSAAYRTCIASTRGFTAVIAECYNAELVRQGERLNRAFETAVAARSGERKQQLVLAQRDWSRLRDSKCQDDDGPDLLHEGSCRLDLTIKRADQLEKVAG